MSFTLLLFIHSKRTYASLMGNSPSCRSTNSIDLQCTHIECKHDATGANGCFLQIQPTDENYDFYKKMLANTMGKSTVNIFDEYDVKKMQGMSDVDVAKGHYNPTYMLDYLCNKNVWFKIFKHKSSDLSYNDMFEVFKKECNSVITLRTLLTSRFEKLTTFRSYWNCSCFLMAFQEPVTIIDAGDTLIPTKYIAIILQTKCYDLHNVIYKTFSPIKMLVDIAPVINKLHKNGRVHLDLKLDNVVNCGQRFKMIDYENVWLPANKITSGFTDSFVLPFILKDKLEPGQPMDYYYDLIKQTRDKSVFELKLFDLSCKFNEWFAEQWSVNPEAKLLIYQKSDDYALAKIVMLWLYFLINNIIYKYQLDTTFDQCINIDTERLFIELNKDLLTRIYTEKALDGQTINVESKKMIGHFREYMVYVEQFINCALYPYEPFDYDLLLKIPYPFPGLVF